MSVHPYADPRASAGASNQNDDKLAEVRELLLGEYQRQCDARLAYLEERIREADLATQRRLDGMQSKIEQLADKSEADQRSAFEELARGIAELSDRIRPPR